MTAADPAALVAVLGEQLLYLCGQASVAPSQARVSVGDVTVEMGWPTVGPGASNGSPPPKSAPSRSAPPTLVEPEPAEPTSVEAAAAEAGTFPLCSSSVGVFYRAPEPSAAPFVVEGDVVRAGQQVAIVEAMKLMIPLTAEQPGRVVSVLVADASPVEHGQPLFLLEPLSGDERSDG